MKKEVTQNPRKCISAVGDVVIISDFDPEKLVTSKLLTTWNSIVSPALISVSIFPIFLRKSGNEAKRIQTMKLSSVTPFKGSICGNVS